MTQLLPGETLFMDTYRRTWKFRSYLLINRAGSTIVTFGAQGSSMLPQHALRQLGRRMQPARGAKCCTGVAPPGPASGLDHCGFSLVIERPNQKEARHANKKLW